MSEFQSVSPVFLVPDVGATARWYRDMLGFGIDTHPQAEPYHWAMASKGGIGIMFQWAPDYRKPDLLPFRPDGGVWDAYFWLSDIDSLYESVRDRVDIIQAPCETPYQRREFMVRDPNGYILVLSEAMEEA